MIAACARRQDSQMALEAFKQMEGEGIKPNIKTYTALVNALKTSGNWRDIVPHYYKQMEMNDIQPDIQVI